MYNNYKEYREGVLMDLKFLGRGAAFNVYERNTSAYFIENQTLFLIDCGESVFSTLIEKNILNDIHDVYILISHTHSDHCGSLGSLGLYCKYVKKIKMKLIIPHDSVYIHSLKLLMELFGNEDTYKFVYEEELDHRFINFETVRYDLTSHTKDLHCYSFVFESKEGAVFYSADTNVVDNVVHFIDTYDNIASIYMEGTDLDIPDDVHLNIDKLSSVIPQHLHSCVYLMHIRNHACVEDAIKNGFHIVKI